MAYMLCILGFIAGWLFRSDTSQTHHALLVKHKYLVLLVVLEISQMGIGLSREWQQQAHFIVGIPLMFAYWLKGPLLYFYYRDLTNQKVTLRTLLHLLPFFTLTLSAQFFIQAQTLVEHHNWWQSIHYDGSLQSWLTVLLTVSVLGVLATYSVSIKRAADKLDADIDSLMLKAACNSQLLVVATATLVYFIWPISGANQLVPLTLSEGLTLTTLTTLISLFVQRTFAKPTTETGKKTLEATEETSDTTKPKVSAKEATALFTLVQQAIESETLYKNPSLRQSDVAKAVGIPTSQLSYVVNFCSDGNYSDLIHQYRIQDAERQIRESFELGEAKTFKDIAMTCGYRSTSSFYTHFKRIFGETPGEYLGKLGAPQEGD